MSALNDSWFQQIASSVQLAPLGPDTVAALQPVVEGHLRNLLQQAYKLQRRSKAAELKVDDWNIALSQNRIEIMYGYKSQVPGSGSTNVPVVGTVDLVDYAKKPIDKIPIAPDVLQHWLAIGGVQPIVPENPNKIDDSWEFSEVVLLPKEMQNLFSRVTAILSEVQHEEGVLAAVMDVLERGDGLQELLPHICKFIYHKIKTNPKSTLLLLRMVRAINSLLLNDCLSLEFYLQQLLPAIFSCAIATRSLQLAEGEEPWLLRESSAEVIRLCCAKYSVTFPDLQARVCKTYLEALRAAIASKSGIASASASVAPSSSASTSALASGSMVVANTSASAASIAPAVAVSSAKLCWGPIYGAVHGLSILGPSVAEHILFPELPVIAMLFESPMESVECIAASRCKSIVTAAVGAFVADHPALLTKAIACYPVLTESRRNRFRAAKTDAAAGSKRSMPLSVRRCNRYDWIDCVGESLIPWIAKSAHVGNCCRLVV